MSGCFYILCGAGVRQNKRSNLAACSSPSTVSVRYRKFAFPLTVWSIRALAFSVTSSGTPSDLSFTSVSLVILKTMTASSISLRETRSLALALDILLPDCSYA